VGKPLTTFIFAEFVGVFPNLRGKAFLFQRYLQNLFADKSAILFG
jgi:hypothetical protein